LPAIIAIGTRAGWTDGDTIIVVTTDHGCGMPRYKRSLRLRVARADGQWKAAIAALPAVDRKSSARANREHTQPFLDRLNFVDVRHIEGRLWEIRTILSDTKRERPNRRFRLPEVALRNLRNGGIADRCCTLLPQLRVAASGGS
jgi:hypothetical protein